MRVSRKVTVLAVSVTPRTIRSTTPPSNRNGRQISEREASERGGEGAVEAERGVGRDRERGGDESKPRLGAERGPQHGER
jgi:hypothetical protein